MRIQALTTASRLLNGNATLGGSSDVLQTYCGRISSCLLHVRRITDVLTTQMYKKIQEVQNDKIANYSN